MPWLFDEPVSRQDALGPPGEPPGMDHERAPVGQARQLVGQGQPLMAAGDPFAGDDHQADAEADDAGGLGEGRDAVQRVLSPSEV